jgi:hypothetical protein
MPPRATNLQRGACDAIDLPFRGGAHAPPATTAASATHLVPGHSGFDRLAEAG